MNAILGGLALLCCVRPPFGSQLLFAASATGYDLGSTNDMVDAGDTIQVIAPAKEVNDMIVLSTELAVTVLLSVEGGHQQAGTWLRAELSQDPFQ